MRPKTADSNGYVYSALLLLRVECKNINSVGSSRARLRYRTQTSLPDLSVNVRTLLQLTCALPSITPLDRYIYIYTLHERWDYRRSRRRALWSLFSVLPLSSLFVVLCTHRPSREVTPFRRLGAELRCSTFRRQPQRRKCRVRSWPAIHPASWAAWPAHARSGASATTRREVQG